MKEIKAYIHPHRTAAVIQALRDSGLCDTAGPEGCHVAVSRVQCIQAAVDVAQQHYSIELGEPVVLQTKLELICSDAATDVLVDLIAGAGHTGQGRSGWVHVHALERRVGIT